MAAVNADLLARDLRYTARTLVRNPGFTAVTILTLALGVGVLTMLFALVDAVLLRPVARDQRAVVRIWKNDAARGLPRQSVSYPEFLALRDRTRTLGPVAAINYADASTSTVTIGDRPAVVSLTPVSADFFNVLMHGAAPLRGRWLEAVDERPGAELAAVVSEGFWRRSLGADPGAIDTLLTWAGSDRTVRIVGIAPRELDYPLGTDMWVPITRFFAGPGSFHFDIDDWKLAQFELLGRLAPGVSAETARAELDALERQLPAQVRDDSLHIGIVLTPILDTVVGDNRQMMIFLLAAAALVFVIAGVNVSALLLMRAAERRSEFVVRAALGASQTRLACQMLVESLVLGALGAIAGLLLARVFLAGVGWLAPADIPRIDRAALDVRIVGCAMASVILWVLALGTAPIWNLRRLDAQTGLTTAAATTRVARRTRALRGFTVVEVGAAVFVAITAVLLLRSFLQLRQLDRGFDSGNLTVINLLLPESRYPDSSRRLAFYEQLLPRVTAIPGVVSASPIHMGPGTGTVGLSASMIFEGQSPASAADNPWATWEPATPSFFRTLGIGLTAGRAFSDADSRTAAPVAIVSESVARRYWPGVDPIGRRLRLAAEFPWVTVVGVARDVRYRELTKAWMTVYFPAEQFFFFAPGSIVVRSGMPARAIVPAIREAIRAQEPYAAIESLATMDTLLDRELSRPRAAMTVAALFAMLAILLGAVGVYAVLAGDVRQRRRELAIKSAIGASPGRILHEILWRSVLLCVIGILGGLSAATVATQYLRAVLYNVNPGDPTAFAIGGALLFLVVLLASCVAARRAASTDPAAVLRTD
jgi:putative ABC transport system permease protein